MKNIEALIGDGGEITLGHLSGIGCVATAADGHNALAMLARRDGETLNALIKRLDKAIGRYYDDGETIDEINSPSD
jgi:hypothetical protein